jgi:hypothetical protein
MDGIYLPVSSFHPMIICDTIPNSCSPPPPPSSCLISIAKFCWLHFLKMKLSDQLRSLAVLPLGIKTPTTHLIGGWVVNLRAYLDLVAKGEIPVPALNWTLVMQLAVSHQLSSWRCFGRSVCFYCTKCILHAQWISFYQLLEIDVCRHKSPRHIQLI